MNNRNIQSYLRSVRSTQAEAILSTCKIHINVDSLRPHVIGGVEKSSDIYKYLKNASLGNGFIQTEYSSKGKTTARMFTKRGFLNIITLNDPIVLKSMDSRYPRGKIICLDYKSFEPSIIRSLIGEVMPQSIHDHMSSILPTIDRNVIKRMNMSLLYATDFKFSLKRACSSLNTEHGVKSYDQILAYANEMALIRCAINKFSDELLEDFEKSGVVFNSYGRKIQPKATSSIFNNIVQSIGSDILVEAIIELDAYLKNKDANIMFHRFDALYLDMSRDAIKKHLGKIIKIMESSGLPVELGIGIQLGDSVATLEEIDIG